MGKASALRCDAEFVERNVAEQDLPGRHMCGQPLAYNPQYEEISLDRRIGRGSGDGQRRLVVHATR